MLLGVVEGVCSGSLGGPGAAEGALGALVCMLEAGGGVAAAMCAPRPVTDAGDGEGEGPASSVLYRLVAAVTLGQGVVALASSALHLLSECVSTCVLTLSRAQPPSSLAIAAPLLHLIHSPGGPGGTFDASAGPSLALTLTLAVLQFLPPSHAAWSDAVMATIVDAMLPCVQVGRQGKAAGDVLCRLVLVLCNKIGAGQILALSSLLSGVSAAAASAAAAEGGGDLPMGCLVHAARGVVSRAPGPPSNSLI